MAIAKPSIRDQLILDRIFPLLVSTLSLIHRLNRYRSTLVYLLSVLCATAWLASLIKGLPLSYSGAAIDTARWSTTLLLIALLALDRVIRTVRTNLNSPVRALNDCLELPPPPAAARRQAGSSGSFQLRRAASVEDVRLVAEFCSKEPVFTKANPALTAQERQRLYKLWFDLCPKSFYILEHHSTGGQVVAAISIILPLTAQGVERLWSGAAGVLELSDRDISASPDAADTTRILLDTLLIAKEFRGIATHKKYPWALVLKHLSEFITRDSDFIEAYVCPDVPSTRKILRQVGFEGPHSTKKERGLYRIQVSKRFSFLPESAAEKVAFTPVKPMAKLLAVLLEAEIMSRILESIDICRRWETQDA